MENGVDVFAFRSSRGTFCFVSWHLSPLHQIMRRQATEFTRTVIQRRRWIDHSFCLPDVPSFISCLLPAISPSLKFVRVSVWGPVKSQVKEQISELSRQTDWRVTCRHCREEQKKNNHWSNYPLMKVEERRGEYTSCFV